MSRDGMNGLRLSGSPVHLVKRESNVVIVGGGGRIVRRSRPRSALSRTTCAPDLPDRRRRPFSAESTSPNQKGDQKQFSLREYLGDAIQVVPPTTALMKDHNNAGTSNLNFRPFDVFSKTSDHGSEETYISLGTKIKTRAQFSNNDKLKNRNYLKYRDIAKRECINHMATEAEKLFDFKVTVSENRANNFNFESDQEDYVNEVDEDKKIEPCTISMETKHNTTPTHSELGDPLAGRVSFGQGAFYTEDQSRGNYFPRHILNEQQLSLVEEESVQDCESLPSQPLSSLSPPTHGDKLNNVEEVQNKEDLQQYTPKEDATPSNHVENTNFVMENPVRTYDSFYDDFISQNNGKQDSNKENAALSSTVFSPSVESSVTFGGYGNANQLSSYEPKLPKYTKHIIKNIDNNLGLYKGDGEQHSSLECITLDNTIETRNLTFSPRPICQWNERGDGPGKSRVLCNELMSMDTNCVQKSNVDKEASDRAKLSSSSRNANEKDVIEEYPQYLSNSLSKAYTSKVIEDYKKEIAAIDNLHELTLKDIQIDPVSPTPYNIDTMFDNSLNLNKTEVHSNKLSVQVNSDKYQFSSYETNREVSNENYPVNLDKNHLSSYEKNREQSKENCQVNVDKNKLSTYEKNREKSIADIPTKELIQNYFRVKQEQPKHTSPKTHKKKIETSMERKSSSSGDSNTSAKWTNKSIHNKPKNNHTIMSPTQKKTNILNEIQQMPLSSRIECVQNDKDVDSWMSTAAPASENGSSAGLSGHNDIIRDSDANQSTSKTTNEQKRKTVLKEDMVKNVNFSEMKETENKNVHEQSTVLDIYTMLKEIESYGENPVFTKEPEHHFELDNHEDDTTPKDNFTEIFTFLEKVEHSANDALSAVTNSAPQTAPRLENLLRLSHTELAQQYITAALQLEERSCCIALLQESLANHKHQMISKLNGMEKQANKNIAKVKQDCDDAIKRHQTFIDQLINDKKTLNERIEQLAEERRALDERWRKSTQNLEQRYKLELKNQHDRMAAAQQVARQRWVRQKAEKIKELTVKGLEGELREMAERAATETDMLRASHAEQLARAHAQHAAALESLRAQLQHEYEHALQQERHHAAARMEKQIIELEATYCEQRTRLIAELRAENERAAADIECREKQARQQLEQSRQEQEREMQEKMARLEEEIARRREEIEEELRRKRAGAAQEVETHKRQAEAEMQRELKRRLQELSAQYKMERDREIERAIESMEAEAQKGRQDLQEALRRNKEQYETELRELGQTEQATVRRYQDAQARSRRAEDKCAELEAATSKLEARNRVLTEKLSQMESVVQEKACSEEEARRAGLAAAQRELEQLRAAHTHQANQLYAKVKVAVARKDSAIQALNRELEKATEKIALLEQKLQQQRKDFLKQK